MNRLPRWTCALALAAIPAAQACQYGSAEQIAEGPSVHAVFVYDRSTSIEDYQLELAGQLTRSVVQNMGHGDRLAAMELLQRSLEEKPKRWNQWVPEREFPDRYLVSDSISRARFLRDAADYLRGFAVAAERGGINGTDILSTLHDVREELREAPEHRTTVYIFSDMLQSNQLMDMEGLRRMPGDSWLAQAEGDGILPDLSETCIVVVGARVDTQGAQRVKRFWEDYFAATGARLLQYGLRPHNVPLPRECAS